MAGESTSEAPRRVLIAGGGVAGLEAMLALRARAGSRVSTTIVAPDPDFVYRPLSTGEPFALAEATRYPLARLAEEHDADLIADAVASVDAPARTVTTRDGETLTFDDLVVALGATGHEAYPEALTFHDQRDVPGYRDLLERLGSGRITRLAFLVPSGIVWPFPLYEIALLTADFARERGLDVELTLVTPASAPLALFGRAASDAMAEMLAQRGIVVDAGNRARIVAPDRALLEPDGDMVHADRFVAIPRLHGPGLPGLPHDADGFIPLDERGRVDGLDHVYAAGDCTSFPFKQGGLAAQQADAVADSIAADVGAIENPMPFRPVLRGMLLTGKGPRFLRAEGQEGRGAGTVADEALWWPPTKIAGRHLAPALGAADAEAQLAEMDELHGGVSIEVPLDHAPVDRLVDLPSHGL